MADCEKKYMKAWRTISKEGRKAGYNRLFFFLGYKHKTKFAEEKISFKGLGRGFGVKKKIEMPNIYLCITL